MSAIEHAAGPQPLPIETVVPFLGATNYELRSLSLGTVLDEDPLREDEIYQRMVAAEADRFYDLKRCAVKNTLVNLPPGLVDIERLHDGRGIQAELTDAGVMAASLGGHLLKLSVISGRSTRVIAGERSPSRSVAGVAATLDSIEGRLAVLTSLHTQAAEEFVPTMAVIEQSMGYGLSRPASYNHLDALREKGIIESREQENGKKGAFTPLEIRLKHTLGEDDLIPPAETVKEFLTVVGRFAIVDPKFYAEGLNYVQVIRSDPELVPYLIERSYRETRHTSKTFDRVKGRKPAR
jgi:DNA-binding transcriptional ArsR family regulator